jgi:hypothetical protein
MSSQDRAWGSMVESLERTTGRSLDDWIALVRTTGLIRHGAITSYLRDEHGLSGGYGNLIAQRALASGDDPVGDELVDQMYAGKNAVLRPIHDAVVAMAMAFGDDVKLEPKKAWVSLRRNKQFAMVGPGTRARIDVCLNLDDVPAAGRLESMTGMASRRVRLSDIAEVDGELETWLRAAYDGR